MLLIALALAAPPDWAQIAKSYPSMPMVADVSATSGAAFLCRMPVPGQDSFHHNTHVRVHVNPIAREAFAQTSGERSFPEGSIIVKVKVDASTLGLAPLFPGQEVPVRPGIGVMVKREVGYAPEADDWQYALVEDGKVYDQPEQVGHCAVCHSKGEIPDQVVPGLREHAHLGPSRDAVFLSEVARVEPVPPTPR
jgi:hypothetical protein